MARGGKRPGAGRKKGSKSPATLEREAALKPFREMVIARVKPLFEAQMTLARGVSYMYWIKENPKTGGKEHILVTDPDEIGDILAQMDGVTRPVLLHDHEGAREQGNRQPARSRTRQGRSN